MRVALMLWLAVQSPDWGGLKTEVVLDGLEQPVAMAFLPDSRALVAARRGDRLFVVDIDEGKKTKITGLPPMLMGGDSGLLDVALEPDGWLYLAFADGARHRSTLAVARAKLSGTTLVDIERLFTADAYSEDRLHYGGRLALANGYLFVTIGDRHHRHRAQELDNHAGTIVRLYEDGRVPQDNPFIGTENALPEIWSYGHRNPQGLAFDPSTGELWAHEHGPLRGDELNRIEKGQNYGWPITSQGWEYEGGPIGMGIVRRDGLRDPVWVWSDTLAPSGLIVYSGSRHGGWRGTLLLGALAGRHLNRLVLRDGRVVLEERRLGPDVGRVRLVAEGPDGTVYLGTDDGFLLRLVES